MNPCDSDAALDLDLELYFGGALIATSYTFCPEELTIVDTASTSIRLVL